MRFRFPVFVLLVRSCAGGGTASTTSTTETATSSVTTTSTSGMSTTAPTATTTALPTPTTTVTTTAATSLTTTVSDDSLYAPDPWIGKVFQTEPLDNRIVYLDGVSTGLRERAGGCLASDCAHQYLRVGAETAEGLDGGYPMMIWHTRQVQPLAGATDSPSWEVIDAEFVDVPPGHESHYECWYPNQTQDELVFALAHRDQPERAVWAWLVGVTTGIISIDVAEVTCLVAD